MHTRRRSTRESVRLETVGRHGTTKADHVRESRGCTSYTTQVLRLLSIRDNTDVHPTCCNRSPNSVTSIQRYMQETCSW